MNRTLHVVRISAVNWPAAVIYPWGILGLAFLVNLAIFAVVPVPDAGGNTTGGLVSIYVVVFVFYSQTTSNDLPFLLSLGVTRRRFFSAVAVEALAQALTYALVLYAFLRIEQATNGWGVSLNFFGVPFLVTGNPVTQVLVYAGPFLLTTFAAALLGAVYARWQMRGMYGVTVALFLTGGLASFLLTWRQGWTALGRWFLDASVVGLLAGWVPLVGLALAAATYGVLRRTPV